MGRKPVIRENYRGDAITIHRIMLAIEQDPDANEAWRGQIVPLLRDAVTLLLSKDAKRLLPPQPIAKRKAG